MPSRCCGVKEYADSSSTSRATAASNDSSASRCPAGWLKRTPWEGSSSTSRNFPSRSMTAATVTFGFQIIFYSTKTKKAGSPLPFSNTCLLLGSFVSLFCFLGLLCFLCWLGFFLLFFSLGSWLGFFFLGFCLGRSSGGGSRSSSLGRSSVSSNSGERNSSEYGGDQCG